jgi:hypothetical protein
MNPELGRIDVYHFGVISASGINLVDESRYPL